MTPSSIPEWLAALAAGMFTVHPEPAPDRAWRIVREELLASLDWDENRLEWSAAELQQAAAAWAVEHVPPEILLRRRWFA